LEPLSYPLLSAFKTSHIRSKGHKKAKGQGEKSEKLIRDEATEKLEANVEIN